MIEIGIAISSAVSAFNMLKKGMQVGKDLQDMGGQLSQWAGAMSDLDFLENKNKNPSVFQIWLAVYLDLYF